MSGLYLDASALVPLFVGEPSSDRIERFLRGAPDELTVSDLAAAEFASAISRLVRTGVLGAADAQDRLLDFDAWRAADTENVDLVAADVRAASAIVRRFELKLRTPDALHLAICRRIGIDLVTLDDRLAAAASDLDITAVRP